MVKRVSVEIYGDVQGVSFRYYTKIEAEKLKIVGYIKNQPDGSILVVAEGKERNLKKLIEWCNRGPGGAIIEKVDIGWQKPTGEFREFMIKYN